MFLIHTTPLRFITGLAVIGTALAVAHDAFGWWL